jgi:hypothetical protein
MRILEAPIEKEELQQMAAKMFGNLVKAVVDTELEIVAIDGELHSDLAELLTEKGSAGKNLWGINIYPDAGDDWLEFDSVINLKPHFSNRSRGVEDPMLREKITEILKKFIHL